MIIRLALDVNVYVNNFKSLFEGRSSSVAQRLVTSAVNGSCRLADIQPIVSHLMLDTLQGVLLRLGFSEILAEVARSVVELAATDGILTMPPIIVLGGSGVQPVLDDEDRSVLETAVAGRADLLVTSNLKDFVPGPRSNITAEVIRRDINGRPDVLLVERADLPHGLVIASVPAAGAWLLDGVTPPSTILQRFRPPGVTA